MLEASCIASNSCCFAIRVIEVIFMHIYVQTLSAVYVSAVVLLLLELGH